MPDSMISQLVAHVQGRVITPEDREYQIARLVYNGMVDKRPAVIVRVAGTDDVVAVVRIAQEFGVDLAIRGGGHSAAGFGTCDRGIVIDFADRDRVRVNPVTARARAEGGVHWAGFNQATHSFGLATTGGLVGTEGIAGLTLGGGVGYLARAYGLTCDNLLSAEVVIADGTVHTASATENEDLFWALRGGGGNFGVVTSFEYQLHPVDMVHAGVIFYSIADARTVAEFYREHLASAPEEFSAFLGFHLCPTASYLPTDWHGKPVCVVAGVWLGDPAEGEARWQPYLDVAPVVGAMVQRMPYPEVNTIFGEGLRSGLHAYWKANFLSELSDGAITAYLDFGRMVPTLQTSVHIYPIDGAVQRVGAEETAFAYRHAKFSPGIACMWDDPADSPANIKWVRDFWTALRPFSEPGGYINFMDSDDQVRIEDNFRSNYDRLATIKTKFDPENLFHLNHNIKPVAPKFSTFHAAVS
ncbi:FAD-binding oxidoreductase [Cryobacterium sinapicolor]|nr:FAD-binding oxidoreductase [Cryobacterium sinapicolor]